MKKLDKYLLRQFITILTMAILGFISVFVIVDLIENIDKFIDNSVQLRIIFLFYFYTLPWFFSIGLPMATLIATVFSIGLMAKRNEWTAMKSSGISLYRIAIPLLLVGIVLSIISYELDNNLVTRGNEKVTEIEQEHMRRKSRRNTFRASKILHDVLLQKHETTHISLAKYSISGMEADNATILSLKNGFLTKRIDARKMFWNDSLLLWNMNNYSIRDFDKNGEEIEVIIANNDTLINANFTPEDITQQFKPPDEMNFSELTERIALLKENGVKTIRWEVARYNKVSFALTSLIVILFGLPLAVSKQKGGLAFAAGMSVFVIFAYYAFIKFGQSLGYKEVLDPFISAWIGNVIFAIGGLILLLSVRK
ncbi:MAG: LptF/LptG family permease [Candidatus Marinimicrobia bacterium]|jgi:lipopolysaccharide export system permease protein|nr:LptF/LptG family permease [Candidatus Neomarinimicrobiota bacterium]